LWLTGSVNLAIEDAPTYELLVPAVAGELRQLPADTQGILQRGRSRLTHLFDDPQVIIKGPCSTNLENLCMRLERTAVAVALSQLIIGHTGARLAEPQANFSWGRGGQPNSRATVQVGDGMSATEEMVDFIRYVQECLRPAVDKTLRTPGIESLKNTFDEGAPKYAKAFKDDTGQHIKSVGFDQFMENPMEDNLWTIAAWLQAIRYCESSEHRLNVVLGKRPRRWIDSDGANFTSLISTLAGLSKDSMACLAIDYGLMIVGDEGDIAIPTPIVSARREWRVNALFESHSTNPLQLKANILRDYRDNRNRGICPFRPDRFLIRFVKLAVRCEQALAPGLYGIPQLDRDMPSSAAQSQVCELGRASLLA
jgi:hypothetical protein